MSRLLKRYREELVPELMKTLGYKNTLAVPRLEKIVVSMGVGKATEEKARMDAAVKDMTQITGQRPLITKARKAVAGFKLRAGQEVGVKVTLRGARMFEFLDRLISVVIPRIRDFRGLPANSFDREGNYSMGLSEQNVFPEISLDNYQFEQGMNIALRIRARRQKDSIELLKRLGMPFRQ